VWLRRPSHESRALERNDVTAVHAVLFDILREVRSIRRLLEEGDDPEEDLADDDSR
jgi:hypothetical protein